MQIFDFNGAQVRTIENNGQPWFVLKDICAVLEIDQVAGIKRRLSEEVISNHPLQTAGGLQQTTFINEDGLYDVILESRKPEAKAFRKWITSEVLPTIRKHGAYMTPETLEKTLSDPDFIITLAQRLKQANEEKAKLASLIEADKPKVIFADSVAASKTSILIGDLAKILKQNGVETGQKRLFAQLREEGYLIKRQGADYNMPTQRSMEMGLFEIKETSISHSDGLISISRTTKVTGKGQIYFINRYTVPA